MATQVCPLCGGSELSYRDIQGEDAFVVDCRICGVFEVAGPTWAMYENPIVMPSDRHLLSALTRTAPMRRTGRVRISADHFRFVREGKLVEKTFAEKRDALLGWFVFESQKNRVPYGAPVIVDPQRDYPVAFCHDTRAGTSPSGSMSFDRCWIGR